MTNKTTSKIKALIRAGGTTKSYLIKGRKEASQSKDVTRRRRQLDKALAEGGALSADVIVRLIELRDTLNSIDLK